jgi:hypothetical protein
VDLWLLVDQLAAQEARRERPNRNFATLLANWERQEARRERPRWNFATLLANWKQSGGLETSDLRLEATVDKPPLAHDSLRLEQCASVAFPFLKGGEVRPFRVEKSTDR